ncbi:MAG: hypothetical protein H0V15_03445 [Solirubrobacterales bacterium]|nr:hypothetical protein [Solirubrobacterales bacterium]
MGEDREPAQLDLDARLRVFVGPLDRAKVAEPRGRGRRAGRGPLPRRDLLLGDRGAHGSYARALYAYDNSKLYVQAVSIYAKLIARDPDAMAILYCWGP